MSRILVAGAFALVASLVLTLLAKRVATHFRLVATPAADRWHRGEVPLLGGAAIAATVLATSAMLGPLPARLWILVGGALALFVVGLVDDIAPLKPQSKFVAQILVAAALAALGLQLRLTAWPLVNLFLTIFWIVAITNAFNLLDNMDGLAAGVAAIATAFRLAFLVADGDLQTAALAAVLLGALLGFLAFNFNPASIFMGDAGSLFVGAMVGGLNLVGTWAYSRSTFSVLLFPVLILLVPIFDTAFVVIARTLAGRSIARGGRDHPSHRLVALGLSEREAVLVLYLVCGIAGAVAAVSYRYRLSYGVVFIAFLVIGLVLFGVYLARLQVYPEHEVKLTEGTRFVTLIGSFAYTRQIATVLVDLVLIVLAYYSAYLLRFEDDFASQQAAFVKSLPVVMACQLLAFTGFRMHRGMWRYTGVADLVRLAKAATVGTALAVGVLLASSDLVRPSRSVFVLDWLILVVLVSATRLWFRSLPETIRPRGGDVKRVLIYGAGDGGVMVLREVRANHAWRREVVGFVDDDRSKHRTSVQGVPVIGGCEVLRDAIRDLAVGEVIVSSSKVAPERVSSVIEVCEPLEVPVTRASLRFEAP